MAIVQKIYRETITLSDPQYQEIIALLNNDLKEEDFNGMGTKKLWDAQVQQVGSAQRIYFNDKIYVKYYIFLDADSKSHIRLDLCKSKLMFSEDRLRQIKTRNCLGRFCFKIDGITYILTIKTESCKLGNVYNIGV